MDRVEFYLYRAVPILTIVATTFSLGHVYKVTTHLAHEVDMKYPGPGLVLRHHFLVMSCYFIISFIGIEIMSSVVFYKTIGEKLFELWGWYILRYRLYCT